MNTLLYTDHNQRYHLYLAADAKYIDTLTVELVGHTCQQVNRWHPVEPISMLLKRTVHMLGLIRVSKPVPPLRAFAPKPPPPPFAIITAINTGATRKRIIDRLFEIADKSSASQDLRVKALCALADIYHMTSEVPNVH